MESSPESSALVRDSISDGIAVHQLLLDGFVPQVVQLAQRVVETFEQSGRVFFLGNGGSAAEAQHFATELLVRFKETRRALPAIALTVDTSVITATGNDFDFSQIFARQVEALVEPRDMVVAFSTSGNSPNVLEAIRVAADRGATTVGFTGNRKGPLSSMVDLALEAPSADTQRIQEVHLLLWHIICDLVDRAFAEKE